MTGADYKKTLAGIRSELEDVLNEELKIERQLRKLRARSEALGKASQCLARLVGEDREEESIGITDAIRKILRDGSNHIWKPTAVRFHLKREEFPIEKYRNPLAVIHTTLKRLEEQSEVKTIEKDGKTLYKWVDPEEKTDTDIPF